MPKSSERHHFISYSSVDAKDFALQLCDELWKGPPIIPAWLDQRKLQPGDDWDEQIAGAIQTCASLLFVVSRDSVEPQSVCKNEWTWALKYKKPIVPLKLHAEAELPFRLNSRQYIDFSGNFDSALAQLRTHLQWLDTPEGLLHQYKDRLADAQRDLRRAPTPTEEARIQAEIEELKQKIEAQQAVVDNPEGTAKRVEESIARGIEREQQPEKPVSGTARSKFINPPPGIAPNYFQDRFVETGLIGDFLRNDAQRLMTVVGRAGIGKTALTCRLLKHLEAGQLPDDHGPLSVDGIVYLSAVGSRTVTVPNLYADLLKLLPDDTAQPLDALYRDPKATTEAKMAALLAAFPAGRVVLLLDNFETVVDPATQTVTDKELGEALRALLNLPHHGVKVLITTRVAPREVALVKPGRQTRLELDEGLESPFAENILREMDTDGKLGLKDAPDDLLDLARRRTRGYPRALEALFAILSADRYTTLDEVLADTEQLLPDHVVEKLVGEAFNRLDPAAQQVMEALAVYARPVTPAAVDFLLQSYLPGVNSAPVLNRLVTMHFARRETGRYYLHPVDREYAFGRVLEGEESDRFIETSPPYARFALLHRGAEYFKQTRKPRAEWQTIDDLAPQLAEFDLRCAGQDYDTAAQLLEDIGYDYLFLWGYYRLMAELHERLQGKLSDAGLKQRSVGNLGTVYRNIGRMQDAITCHKQALTLAHDANDRYGEGVGLGNLGLAYRDLGQVETAIEYHQQALAIVREIGDKRGEGRVLGNLGNAYSDLGQIETAIDYYSQALTIVRDINDRRSEGGALSNLGNRYADLGQSEIAIDYYQQAFAISREIGDRRGESITLENMGQILVDRNEFEQAIETYEQAIQIADNIGLVLIQNYGRRGLVLAYLYAGNLSAARAAIDAARQYDVPENNHNVLASLGVIALRQGERAVAEQAFTQAIAQADALLAHTVQNYDAWDAKGLALCGLALCQKDLTGLQDLSGLDEAVEAYRAARAITGAAGIVKRELRLLDALVQAHPEGVTLLAEARQAAAQLDAAAQQDAAGGE